MMHALENSLKNRVMKELEVSNPPKQDTEELRKMIDSAVKR